MFKTIKARLGSIALSAVLLAQISSGVFAAQPAAQIGDTTYDTMWQALEAVQNGETIEVLRDISDEQLTLFCTGEDEFSITIDLNGHTIAESTTNSPAFTYVSSDGTVAPSVTIKEGRLRCTSEQTSGSPYASGIWVESLDTSCRPILILEHMAVASQHDAGINCIDAQLHIGSASINAYDDAIYAQNAYVYIQAGSFYTTSGTDSGNGTLVSNESTIEMTASDGIIKPTDWQTQKSTLVQAVWFEDVRNGSWYYDAVYALARQEIVNGMDCWTFAPGNNITRAEFVTLLAKASGQDVSSYSASSTFSDVSSSAWYDHYVGWAVANDIASGVGDDQFKPADPISREQMAVMLLQYQTNIMQQEPVDKVTPADFADIDSVASWAQDAMSIMCRQGIINGTEQADGTVLLQPQANATRAQACAMLNNLFNL